MAALLLTMNKASITKKPILTLIHGDTRTTIVNFKIPRYQGGVDLSVLGWDVAFINAAELTDMHMLDPVSIDDDYVTVKWLIHGKVTSEVGTTLFEIEGRANTDDNSNTVLWQSGQRAITVSSDIEATPSGEESDYNELNTLVQQLTVVLPQYRSLIDGLIEQANEQDTKINSNILTANSLLEQYNNDVSALNNALTNAVNSASNALTYMNSAYNYKELAKQYSLNATNKASIAESSAKTALTKATEASNSADSAAESAKQAEDKASKISTDLTGKQDVITDLEDIRKGAKLGLTAVQSVPTNISAFTNDAGYITSDSIPEDVASKTYVDDKIDDIIGTAPEALNTLKLISDAINNDADFATTIVTSIENKMDKLNPTGTGSLNIGELNTGSDSYSTYIIGKKNNVTGLQSLAIGYNNTILDQQCYVHGYSNKVNKIANGTNNWNFVNGSKNSVAGSGNYVLGLSHEISKGYYSHVLGYGSTNDNGSFSHILGVSNEAHDILGGHVLGYNNIINNGTIGDIITRAPHVEGICNVGYGLQHVEGCNNIIDSLNKYLHIVGNGLKTIKDNRLQTKNSQYDSLRSNAYTLDWDGNGLYQGDVKANACGGTTPISLVETATALSTLQGNLVIATADEALSYLEEDDE